MNFRRQLDCVPLPKKNVWASASAVARKRVRIVGDDLFAAFTETESDHFDDLLARCGGKIQKKKDFAAVVGGVRRAGGVFLEQLYTTEPAAWSESSGYYRPGRGVAESFRVVSMGVVRMSALMGDAPAAMSAGELVRFAVSGVKGRRLENALAVARDVHRHHLKTLNTAKLPLYGPTWLPGGGFPHHRGHEYEVRRLPRLYQAAIVYGASLLPALTSPEWVKYRAFRDFWTDTRMATLSLVGGTTFRALRRAKRRIDSSSPQWFGFDVSSMSIGDERRIVTLADVPGEGGPIDAPVTQFIPVHTLAARLTADESRLDWFRTGRVEVSKTRSRPATRVACEARKGLARHAGRYRVSANIMRGTDSIRKLSLANAVGAAFKMFVVNPDHFSLNSLRVRGTTTQPSRRHHGGKDAERQAQNVPLPSVP